MAIFQRVYFLATRLVFLIMLQQKSTERLKGVLSRLLNRL